MKDNDIYFDDEAAQMRIGIALAEEAAQSNTRRIMLAAPLTIEELIFSPDWDKKKKHGKI